MSNDIISVKSKAFAIRMIRFYQYLQEKKKDFVISKQILRSGTSIGANIRESKNAQSVSDFISKINISLKEADETAYWLELLQGSNLITNSQYDSLNCDLSEIIGMLTASIKTAKENLRKRETLGN
jgi:four helix bundle protein